MKGSPVRVRPSAFDTDQPERCVGEVTGEARLAKDFNVERDGQRIPYLDVARAREAGQDADDPKLAEWVVPVHWLSTRTRSDAIKDSDFFANQNSAVKMTHSYTLTRLVQNFGVEGTSLQTP